MFTYYNMVIMGDEKCILILISFFLNYPLFSEFNGWACTGYLVLFYFGMKDTAFALYCMGVFLLSLCFRGCCIIENSNNGLMSSILSRDTISPQLFSPSSSIPDERNNIHDRNETTVNQVWQILSRGLQHSRCIFTQTQSQVPSPRVNRFSQRCRSSERLSPFGI